MVDRLQILELQVVDARQQVRQLATLQGVIASVGKTDTYRCQLLDEKQEEAIHTQQVIAEFYRDLPTVATEFKYPLQDAVNRKVVQNEDRTTEVCKHLKLLSEPLKRVKQQTFEPL